MNTLFPLIVRVLPVNAMAEDLLVIVWKVESEMVKAFPEKVKAEESPSIIEKELFELMVREPLPEKFTTDPLPRTFDTSMELSVISPLLTFITVLVIVVPVIFVFSLIWSFPFELNPINGLDPEIEEKELCDFIVSMPVPAKVMRDSVSEVMEKEDIFTPLSVADPDVPTLIRAFDLL